jgi:hypothetical protein
VLVLVASNMFHILVGVFIVAFSHIVASIFGDVFAMEMLGKLLAESRFASAFGASDDYNF